MAARHPMAERQCTAHNRQGGRCEHYALTGTNVCRHHGGAAPQVKNAIRRRLLAAADPALGELLRLLRKGRPDAVKRQAASDILDRAGFKAAAEQQHTGPAGGPLQIQVLFRDVGKTGE